MAAEKLYFKSILQRHPQPVAPEIEIAEHRALTAYHHRREAAGPLLASSTPQNVGLAPYYAPQLTLALPPRLKVVETTADMWVPSHLSSFQRMAVAWVARRGQARVLWAHGASGSGKTGILKAALATLPRDVPSRVTTADRFLADWVQSFRGGKSGEIAEYKSRTEILVLEGIESLENKLKTQIEVLKTIEAIHSRGGGVVVTSLRSPEELREAINPALRDKMAAGIVLPIPGPSSETALEIVERELTALFRDPDDRQSLVGRMEYWHWRSLAGITSFVANIRMRLEAGVILKDIPLEEIHMSTNGSGPRVEKVSPQVIVEKVCALFGIPVAEVMGGRRTKHVSLARLFCYRALYDLGGVSQSDVAELLKRDPSSVNKGIQHIKQRIEGSSTLQRKWEWVVGFIERGRE